MVETILYLIKLLYIILPGTVANMVPIFMKNMFKDLAFPLDFNKKIKGKPILGNHKTFRGLFFGVVFSIIVVWIQQILYYVPFFKSISIIDYSIYNFGVLGFLMGFGVLFGDSVKSFFKRRLNIKPGKSFFPWDQLDAPLGAIIFVAFIYRFTVGLVISLLVISLLMHLFIRTLGYYLKINKERW